MSPSTLRKFAASKEASLIRAGFEAEVVFPGILNNTKPIHDLSKDQEVESISDIINYFTSNDVGLAGLLEKRLSKSYASWAGPKLKENFIKNTTGYVAKFLVDNYWDLSARVEEGLTEQGLIASDLRIALEDAEYMNEGFNQILPLGKSGLRKLENYSKDFEFGKQIFKVHSALYDELIAEAEDVINGDEDLYADAKDYYVDNFAPTEKEWLESIGVKTAFQITQYYDLPWDHYTNFDRNKTFNLDMANWLAKSLSKLVKMPVVANKDHGSEPRGANKWVIEPDTSINPDNDEDMGAEIISPPLPLSETLDLLEPFFKWARQYGAYSNKSTGFHMGVSIDGIGGNVDYVKFALFLGDEYVLEQFGRQANEYCQSYVKRVVDSQNIIDPEQEFVKLNNKLHSIAKGEADTSLKFGKYFSINPKDDYIEVRSAGGVDYFEANNIDKLANTLMRYAQALHIASDPAAERKEYFKKLYKLLEPSNSDIIELFAQRSTGLITTAELRTEWAKLKKTSDGMREFSVISNISGKPVKYIKVPLNDDPMETAHRLMVSDTTRYPINWFKKAYTVLPK